MVTVETALCLGLLLTLVFGGLDAFRALSLRHAMENAAYEAARVAMVPGATAEEARGAAGGLLGLAGARGAAVTIEPATITALTEEVTVTLSVSAAGSGCVLSGVFLNLTLEESCTLRTERATR